MQLSRLANDYLKYKAFRGGSARTNESYDAAYSQFLAYLVSGGFSDDTRNFTPENIEGFLRYLAEHELKASSINNRLSALSSLGRYGVRTRDARGKFVLGENPVERIERPKKVKPREKYLTRDELQQLRAVACPAQERLAMELLIDTQLRASELAKAKVRDLSLDGERVLLAVTVKGGRPETVTLGADVANLLIESLKFREAGPDASLIVGASGLSYSRTSLSEVIAKLARRAGITRIAVRAHLLARHTPASLAGQAGASVFEIAAMLRHSDLSTARRYVHGVSGDAIRERVRALIAPAVVSAGVTAEAATA